MKIQMKNTAISLFFTLIVGLAFPAFAAEGNGSAPFSDVPANAWYAPYAAYCQNAGLMQGVGGGRFAPAETVTYAEMIVVCARLHHILQGGNGDIPSLPAEGPAGLIYFTNNSGNKIATLSDLSHWSSSDRGMLLFFQGETLSLLRAEPYDTLQIHFAFGDFKTYPCVYSPDADNPDAYVIPFEKGDVFAEGFFGLFVTLSTGTGEYTGKWYESALWYMQNLPLEGRSEAFRAQLDEITKLIESDYPETNLYGFSSLEKPCPRVMLLPFLSISIPEKHLTPLHEDVAIPDVDSAFARQLYAAGVLSGIDPQGTFGGHQFLLRTELAAILARSLNPEFRI